MPSSPSPPRYASVAMHCNPLLLCCEAVELSAHLPCIVLYCAVSFLVILLILASMTCGESPLCSAAWRPCTVLYRMVSLCSAFCRPCSLQYDVLAFCSMVSSCSSVQCSEAHLCPPMCSPACCVVSDPGAVPVESGVPASQPLDHLYPQPAHGDLQPAQPQNEPQV